MLNVIIKFKTKIHRRILYNILLIQLYSVWRIIYPCSERDRESDGIISLPEIIAE